MTEWYRLSIKSMIQSPARVRLVWLSLSLACLGMFFKVTSELYEDSKLDDFDKQVLVAVSHFRISALNGPAVDFTALGSPTVITTLTVFGAMLLWIMHDRRRCFYLVTGSVGAGLGTALIKHVFTRDRPSIVPRLVQVSGFSYPSGHSFAATTIYLVLMFIGWHYSRQRASRLALLFMAVVLISGVCLSRIYLGVHYPSDVVSGSLLGSAWVCLLTAAFADTKTNIF